MALGVVLWCGDVKGVHFHNFYGIFEPVTSFFTIFHILLRALQKPKNSVFINSESD